MRRTIKPLWFLLFAVDTDVYNSIPCPSRNRIYHNIRTQFIQMNIARWTRRRRRDALSNTLYPPIMHTSTAAKHSIYAINKCECMSARPERARVSGFTSRPPCLREYICVGARLYRYLLLIIAICRRFLFRFVFVRRLPLLHRTDVVVMK